MQPVILHGFPPSLPPTGACGSPFLLGGPRQSLLTPLQLQVLHSSPRDGGNQVHRQRKKSEKNIHAPNNPTGISSRPTLPLPHMSTLQKVVDTWKTSPRCRL